jgi:RNA polymerase sigma-70 factor (ECF subfamily)
VARIIGKTEVNCRQIFARARRRITAGAPPSLPTRQAEGQELARRFFEAAAGGDMQAMLDLLAPDVVLHGGGKAQVIGKPLAGRRQVGWMLSALFRRARILDVRVQPAWTNGQPGVMGAAAWCAPAPGLYGTP